MSIEPNLTDQDYELLSAYLDGVLEEDERQRLEARLAAEPVLRRELAALRQTVALINQLPTLKAPRNFTLPVTVTETKSDINGGSSTQPILQVLPPVQRSAPIRVNPAISILSAAAAVLVVFALIGLLLSATNTRNDEPANVSNVAAAPTAITEPTLMDTFSAAAETTDDDAVVAEEEGADEAEAAAASELSVGTPPATPTLEVAFTNSGELSTAERLTAVAIPLTEQAQQATADAYQILLLTDPAAAPPAPPGTPLPFNAPSNAPFGQGAGGAGQGGGGNGQAEEEFFGDAITLTPMGTLPVEAGVMQAPIIQATPLPSGLPLDSASQVAGGVPTASAFAFAVPTMTAAPETARSAEVAEADAPEAASQPQMQAAPYQADAPFAAPESVQRTLPLLQLIADRVLLIVRLSLGLLESAR
ncbi:MAG: zf-HC2 domain-containing protein [bacterium]|nr:zf-HC2 domain-containing protein [bacterium]